MPKEKYDLLESSTEERAQKEEKIVKLNELNEKMIKLEENVAIFLASKEQVETELTRVGKSMLKDRDKFLAHSKDQQAKLEENMVILKADRDCAEKHVRDVKRREESLPKEKYDLLESSTEERAQKEEESVKLNELNEQMINLEERVSTLLGSKKNAETEFKRVEKSMLEGRDELLAHLTENKSEQAKLEDNMVMLRSENNCAEKHVRDVEKRDE